MKEKRERNISREVAGEREEWVGKRNTWKKRKKDKIEFEGERRKEDKEEKRKREQKRKA